MKIVRSTLMSIMLTATLVNGCAADSPQIPSELPIASISCHIAKDKFELFSTALRTFADRQEYAIRISFDAPGDKTTLIQMWREDIKIIGTNEFDREQFQISSYATDPRIPLSRRVAESTMDKLRVDLQSIGECADAEDTRRADVR